jgi:hypothetical protein
LRNERKNTIDRGRGGNSRRKHHTTVLKRYSASLVVVWDVYLIFRFTRISFLFARGRAKFSRLAFVRTKGGCTCAAHNNVSIPIEVALSIDSMRIIFHLRTSSHRFNSCPPTSKASSISPAVPSTCPIVNITQKYSPAANAGGPPPSEASSICPSTSSIVNSTEHSPSAAANAGGPSPSEAFSLTFSIINSTKQVVNVESLDVSIQDG